MLACWLRSASLNETALMNLNKLRYGASDFPPLGFNAGNLEGDPDLPECMVHFNFIECGCRILQRGFGNRGDIFVNFQEGGRHQMMHQMMQRRVNPQDLQVLSVIDHGGCE
jgi:hypothetical protein